jgi:hypothetical protein
MLIFARRANLQGISVGSTQMFEAEPGYCGEQAQADHRQGVFVRRCTGGVPLFAVSAAFRESRNQPRPMMQVRQHIRMDGNLRDQILRLEARC